MNQGTTRRFVASVLLAASATALAACGVARGPIAPAGISTASSFATRVGETDRKFGLKFDNQTQRVAYVPGSITAGLPPAADLRDKCSPIDDQGHIGACTGFMATGLAEFRARATGNTAELSPGFVYLMELKEDGNLGQDAGSRISTAMKVLNKYGIATEAMHPYLAPADQADAAKLTAYLSKLPSAEAMADAAKNKIAGAKKVSDLNGFKAAIAKGHPVGFGIMVYKSFMSPEAKTTGVIPMPDTSHEQLLGGHAILAVGYDDAKQQVIFRNSWSPKWGDKGYGYLPYGYFKGGLAGDAWEAN